MTSLSPLHAATSDSPQPLWKPLLAGAGVLLVTLWLLRLLFSPDPTGQLWLKAQRLERDNLPAQALQLYELIWKGDSASAYAPQALQREADILTAEARRDGSLPGLRASAALYEHLATTYSESPLAGPAFLTAGGIAMDELHDSPYATRLFAGLLNRYPNNQGFAAEALARLGRLAMGRGARADAQRFLQRVLQKYPKALEPGAEAQYHLGVLYETLFHNREWALNAYDATMRRYPASLWASSARARLGLLAYGDQRPRARRVLIRTLPVPETTEGGDLLSALKPLLAARGLEFSDATLRGLTLAPFVSGFNPASPGSTVRMTGDGAFNVAANAGLMTQIQRGGDPVSALQQELDRGRPSAVFTGRWRLCVGYDSALKQVFLSGPGGALDVIGVKEFGQQWAGAQALKTPRAMVTLWAPGDKPQAATAGKPQPSGTLSAALPTPTPLRINQLQTPTWEFQAPPLKARDAYIKTLRRAALLLKRPHQGGALLNMAALDGLAREVESVSRAAPPRPATVSQAPQAMPTPTFAPDDPLPLPGESAPDEAALPRDSDIAPRRVTRTKPTARDLARWRAVSGWFGAPCEAWIAARRDAAAFLDEAANALNDANVKAAADALRAEVAALEAARDAVPAPDSALDAPSRSALREAARQLRSARASEARAAALLSGMG